MIKRYSFTHPEIDGQVIFEFDHGLLTYYKLDGEAALTVIHHMLLRLPINIEMLSKISKNVNAKFTEIEIDLSFDRFMAVYNHKPAGYSKSNTERKWNKMSVADKQDAIKYVKQYDAELSRSGIAKKYPETFLNQKVWVK